MSSEGVVHLIFSLALANCSRHTSSILKMLRDGWIEEVLHYQPMQPAMHRTLCSFFLNLIQKIASFRQTKWIFWIYSNKKSKSKSCKRLLKNFWEYFDSNVLVLSIYFGWFFGGLDTPKVISNSIFNNETHF